VRRFRFRLERLLELRARREREALYRLAEATGHCVRLARRIQELGQERGAAFRSVPSGQGPGGAGPLDLGLFAYRERYLAWLEATRRRFAQELERRERQRLEVQARYLEAAKEHKVLEKLKERRAAEHRRLARIEEFNVQDDVAASQYLRALE
jgi:flagellar FliJ protein